MKIGPKYKIARRLGAAVFEKTQTQKFALSLERKAKKGFTRPKTEFGLQLNEKQKARLVYALTEKQFSNYVKEAIARKSSAPTQTLYEFLERRVDNVVYRMGLSSTRLGAKQMVSHGHIAINGRRITTPSMRLSIGDKVSINARSQNKPLFTNAEERIKDVTVPAWLSFDKTKKTGEVTGLPVFVKTENVFDLNTVIEFYSR